MCITGALLNPSVVSSIVPSTRTLYGAAKHPRQIPKKGSVFRSKTGKSLQLLERGLILGELEGLKVRGFRHADYSGDIGLTDQLALTIVLGE